jgi:nickel superoxide dismutase
MSGMSGQRAIGAQPRSMAESPGASGDRDDAIELASTDRRRRSPMDLLRLIAPARSAHAHCDIPCGVYDPEQARIEAESCHRIIERYHASSDEVFRARCIVVKEERAELVKHHIDVLWHDYFKPEHVEQFPELHDICWRASKQASAVKQGVDLEAAKKLLALIDQIDEMWKGSGGPTKTRMAS